MNDPSKRDNGDEPTAGGNVNGPSFGRGNVNGDLDVNGAGATAG